MIPIITSLLKCSSKKDFGYSRDVDMDGTAILLDAFNRCIAADVTPPQTAWNVILKQYSDSLSSSSFTIIYAKLADFYGIVGEKCNGSEQSLLFSQEILKNHLIPLLEHTDEIVFGAAYNALTNFQFEDFESMIPAPQELVQKFQKNPIPFKSFIQFMIKRECLTMSRPVFKGIGIEPGAKNSTKTNINFVKSIRDISQSLFRYYESGVLSKAAAPAILAFPTISDNDHDLQLKRLISSLAIDLSCVDSQLLALDCLDMWSRFWMAQTNYIIEAGKPVEVVNEWIDHVYNSINDSGVPSSISMLYLCATGLVMTIIELQLNPSPTFASDLSNRLKNELQNPALPLEIQSIILFSLTELGFGSDIFATCLNPDSAISHGFAACKYISTLESDLNEAKGRMDSFLDCFFSSGWKTLGSAIGFSLLMKDFDEFLKQIVHPSKLSQIFSNALECLENEKSKHKDINCSIWIVSCGQRIRQVNQDFSAITISFEKAIKKVSHINP